MTAITIALAWCLVSVLVALALAAAIGRADYGEEEELRERWVDEDRSERWV